MLKSAIPSPLPISAVGAGISAAGAAANIVEKVMDSQPGFYKKYLEEKKTSLLLQNAGAGVDLLGAQALTHTYYLDKDDKLTPAIIKILYSEFKGLIGEVFTFKAQEASGFWPRSVSIDVLLTLTRAPTVDLEELPEDTHSNDLYRVLKKSVPTSDKKIDANSLIVILVYVIYYYYNKQVKSEKETLQGIKKLTEWVVRVNVELEEFSTQYSAILWQHWHKQITHLKFLMRGIQKIVDSRAKVLAEKPYQFCNSVTYLIMQMEFAKSMSWDAMMILLATKPLDELDLLDILSSSEKGKIKIAEQHPLKEKTLLEKMKGSGEEDNVPRSLQKYSVDGYLKNVYKPTVISHKLFINFAKDYIKYQRYLNNHNRNKHDEFDHTSREEVCAESPFLNNNLIQVVKLWNEQLSYLQPQFFPEIRKCSVAKKDFHKELDKLTTKARHIFHGAIFFTDFLKHLEKDAAHFGNSLLFCQVIHQTISVLEQFCSNMRTFSERVAKLYKSRNLENDRLAAHNKKPDTDLFKRNPRLFTLLFMQEKFGFPAILRRIEEELKEVKAQSKRLYKDEKYRNNSDEQNLRKFLLYCVMCFINEKSLILDRGITCPNVFLPVIGPRNPDGISIESPNPERNMYLVEHARHTLHKCVLRARFQLLCILDAVITSFIIYNLSRPITSYWTGKHTAQHTREALTLKDALKDIINENAGIIKLFREFEEYIDKFPFLKAQSMFACWYTPAKHSLKVHINKSDLLETVHTLAADVLVTQEHFAHTGRLHEEAKLKYNEDIRILKLHQNENGGILLELAELKGLPEVVRLGSSDESSDSINIDDPTPHAAAPTPADNSAPHAAAPTPADNSAPPAAAPTPAGNPAPPAAAHTSADNSAPPAAALADNPAAPSRPPRKGLLAWFFTGRSSTASPAPAAPR